MTSSYNRIVENGSAKVDFPLLSENNEDFRSNELDSLSTYYVYSYSNSSLPTIKEVSSCIIV